MNEPIVITVMYDKSFGGFWYIHDNTNIPEHSVGPFKTQLDAFIWLDQHPDYPEVIA